MGRIRENSDESGANQKKMSVPDYFCFHFLLSPSLCNWRTFHAETNFKGVRERGKETEKREEKKSE